MLVGVLYERSDESIMHSEDSPGGWYTLGILTGKTPRPRAKHMAAR